jgi:hypothetical protein
MPTLSRPSSPTRSHEGGFRRQIGHHRARAGEQRIEKARQAHHRHLQVAGRQIDAARHDPRPQAGAIEQPL